MTSRISQPDTAADIELRECLDQQPPRSFVMVAGAGSGKTTSLVKALAHLAKSRGLELRKRGQKIACITYTDIAVREIWGDIGNDGLFHVSTIHSFLWTVVRPFQHEIKAWVLGRIAEKIAEAHTRLDSPRTRAQTRPGLERAIVRYQDQCQAVRSVKQFKYGTGSDYARGVLGHADILKLVPALIQDHQLLRTLIAGKFPCIFVDESQDTVPEFVSALRRIEGTVGEGFCLGFFGDPMQKIYTTGVGSIIRGDGWSEITKPENFRCPQRVLRVINAIRAEDDGLEQTHGRTVRVAEEVVSVEGTARIFLLPADGRRSNRLDQVRRWLAIANDDGLWESDEKEAEVRALVLVHRMAAIRLGFPNIYAALNDNAPPSLKDGLSDGSAWILRPFLAYLLPLVFAARSGNDFDVISALREECPLMDKDELPHRDVSVLLHQIRDDTATLVQMLAQDAGVTNRQVLKFAVDRKLIELDDRFDDYLDHPDMIADDDADPEASCVIAFLGCQAHELWGYRHYIEDQSPFATQQGVKGAEFDRVLVVIDDDEGSAQRQISYGKYFGITPLSNTDNDNIAAGIDSVLGRTRRLFYVCCSRAVQDLAVVMFLPDVEAVREQIEAKRIFPPEDIHGVADLERLTVH